MCIVASEFERKVCYINIHQSTAQVLPILLILLILIQSLTSHLPLLVVIITHNARWCRFHSCFPHPYVLTFSSRTELTSIVGGFVLLLLVTLSVPIIKSIHLLVVDFGDGGGGVRAATIGVFGACYEGIAPRLVF